VSDPPGAQCGKVANAGHVAVALLDGDQTGKWPVGVVRVGNRISRVRVHVSRWRGGSAGVAADFVDGFGAGWFELPGRGQLGRQQSPGAFG
jgi:hypothetical protein